MIITNTSKIVNTPRQSNIELLRIVAMFFVLIVHACFLPFGAPTSKDVSGSPLLTSIFIFTEFLAIVGANVFVLISGWFGIHASAKGFMKLMFQSVYFLLGAYIVGAFFNIGIESHSYMRLIQSLTGSAAWFIPSYIGLYAFSPILNSWMKRVEKKMFLKFLFFFFLIELIYGFIPSDPPSYFSRGYSAISFMGLYCLARYIRLYGRSFCEKYGSVILYVILSGANSLIYIYIACVKPEFLGLVLSYINPITIVASCSLLIAFSKMKIRYNKLINWISASSFGVYLLNAGFAQTYESSVFYVGMQYGLLWVCVFVVSFFLIGILLDQPRKYIWNKIVICLKDKL